MNIKDLRNPGHTLMSRFLRYSAISMLCATLAACGFHLRGQTSLPFESIYVAGSTPIAGQIARAVRSGSQTRITTNPKDAHILLEILAEQRDRTILSLSSSGRVRELSLNYRVSYRLLDQKNNEPLPASDILLRRDLSYNDTDVITKEQEEALLYRDMQSDAVQQLLRRLQATRVSS